MLKFIVIVSTFILSVSFSDGQIQVIPSWQIEHGENLLPDVLDKIDEDIGSKDRAVDTIFDESASWRRLPDAMSHTVESAAEGRASSSMYMYVGAADGWTAPWIERGTHVTNTFTRVRNPDVWIDADLTAISPWNDREYNWRTGTLITERHMVNAVHFPLEINDQVVFIGPDNQVVERTITHREQIGGVDIMLYQLNSDVPDYITPALLPGDDWVDSYMRNSFGVTTDQDRRVGVIEFWYHAYPPLKARVDNVQNLALQPVDKDSGNPAGWITPDSKFVTVFTWETTSTGPNLRDNRAAIQTQLDTWGTGHTVSVYGRVPNYELANVYQGDVADARVRTDRLALPFNMYSGRLGGAPSPDADHSFSYGANAVAGQESAAFGAATTAGLRSFAAGSGTTAGDHAVAFGRDTVAGNIGAAFGWNSVADVLGFSAGLAGVGGRGSFVFADEQYDGSTPIPFDRSATADSFNVRAHGGTYFDLGATGEFEIDGDVKIEGNVIMNGTVTMPNLPTTDPAVAGQLWNDNGTLKVSAGI